MKKNKVVETPIPELSNQQPQMSLAKSLPMKSSVTSSSVQRSAALTKVAAFTSKYAAKTRRTAAAINVMSDSDPDMSISLDEDVLATVPDEKRLLLVCEHSICITNSGGGCFPMSRRVFFWGGYLIK